MKTDHLTHHPTQTSKTCFLFHLLLYHHCQRHQQDPKTNAKGFLCGLHYQYLVSQKCRHCQYNQQHYAFRLQHQSRPSPLQTSASLKYDLQTTDTASVTSLVYESDKYLTLNLVLYDFCI